MAHESRVDEFVRLFVTYELRLRSLAVSMVADYADVEDVLQEASLTLWRKFDQFQPGTNFMGWAGRVIYLEAVQHRRRKGHDRLIFGDAALDAVTRVATSDEVTAEMAARERALAGCVAKLRPEQREMLRVRYLEGRSIEAMGVVFDRSANAVYSVLSRIRRDLRTCITNRLRADRRLT